MSVYDLFLASSLFGTKHLILYAVIIIAIVAIAVYMMRRSPAGRV